MDISKTINPIIAEFTTEFILDLQDAARKRVGSKESAQKIDGAVLRATATRGATIMIDFAEHLRFYDMRNVQRRNQLTPRGIERIKEWIQEKGISSFLKGYKYPLTRKIGGRSTPVPMNRILNNIAWGIARKRSKLRRRRWYNKLKGTSTYKLYARLVDAVLEESLIDIKSNLSKS